MLRFGWSEAQQPPNDRQCQEPGVVCQHLSVAGLWESDSSNSAPINRMKVTEAVAREMSTPGCVALYADPPLWRAELDEWSRRWPNKVFEWPTASRQRMGPATDRFRAAVVEGRMTHDGNQRLAVHVANCVAEPSEFGDLVRKEFRGSPRKIDAAVAAIVALDRASWHAQQQPKRGSKWRVAL